MIVVLHNIRSMHNVGAVFRTSDAAGVKKIYLCGFTPSPINEFNETRVQIHKVALGAENFVEWEKCKRTYAVLDRLKKQGYKIYAIEQTKDSVPYHKVKLSPKQEEKAVLVVGHELKGLTPGILKRADKVLEIPMVGQKHSLNVSVAFGVVVFSLKY